MTTLVLILGLLATGIWGLVLLNNAVKKVMALNIVTASIVILFIHRGSLSGAAAPILLGENAAVVDPVPQALMLTAIVIGVCLTALALVLVYRLYKRYGTLDCRDIERAIRDEID